MIFLCAVAAIGQWVLFLFTLYGFLMGWSSVWTLGFDAIILLSAILLTKGWLDR